jgi:hypothetical protein
MWKKGQQGSTLGQWKPGQQGDNRGSRPGVKPGTIRGPYKTKRSQAELHDLIEQQKNPTMKPTVKLVEGKEKHIDTKEYLKQVVATDTLSHRERTTAALGLLPFEYVKAEGRYLGFQWDEPAPRTLDQAIEQTQKIIELERLGTINSADATTLHDRINRIAQLFGWHDLAKRVEALEAKDIARQEAGDASGVKIAIISDLPQLPGNEQLLMPGRQTEEGYVVTGVNQQSQEAGGAEASPDSEDKNPGRDGQG